LSFEEDKLLATTQEEWCSCSWSCSYYEQVTIVNTLKFEDRLEGTNNFCAWKARALLLLEENDLKEYVESVVTTPTIHRS
jgi:hypothetical protein